VGTHDSQIRLATAQLDDVDLARFRPTLGLDVAIIYTASGNRYGGSPDTGFYGTYKSTVFIPSFGMHILF
jgi:hypothetical protein